jgi:hypothetical protein
MFLHRVAPLLPLAFMLFAEPAGAFLDPPYITPSNPSAGDAISVSIYGGECDLVHDGVTWPPPVTQKGNDITILFTGIHEGDPEFCYYSVGTRTYPVGSFPKGSYTLHVEWRYVGPGAAWIQETLGIIPFTVVAGGPPQPAPMSTPTLSIAGLSILLLVLLSVAVWRLRLRQA